ncbi:uncharacterized protein LOC112906227 isoform X2 [Agrilus planipennis]|uniref:Uncharacterized protein LOC112906227 isoform X2 n=1 Tax=Agrilus planipennis TaxID=224129 RepID=A0A7F5RIJ1_AGRPL|nr:uncharacterized protein LOC112906227 isoform X2 [Agrilus planipennis]
MSKKNENRLIENQTNGSNHLLEEDRVTVIDGGFSTQLSCHVQDPIDGDVLWSARFLSTNPQAVINTHLDFLRAGAEVIITNTYQASISGFVEHLNLTKEQSYDLIKEAVSLAKQARFLFEEQYFEDASRRLRKPLIAGSVGPYGASLHDGSEYTGSYSTTTSVETMEEYHRPRIEALLEGGVDLLAMETIPCKKEAEMLVKLLKEYPHIKAWLSFSCSQDGKSISCGEDFQEVVRHCYDLNPDQLVAVGANCLAPRLVKSLFDGINNERENNPIPLIVYPNSGETYNVETGWLNRDKCEPLDLYVKDWLNLGIRWMGGCCRTYAADISRIKNEVSKWTHVHKSIQN